MNKLKQLWVWLKSFFYKAPKVPSILDPVEAPIIVNLPIPSINEPAQHSITLFESTKELIQVIPITAEITNYKYNNIYTIRLPDLEPGDILQITSKCQLTGVYVYSVMIAGYLQIRSSKGSSYLSKPSGCDIVEGIEHCTWNINKQHLVKESLKDVYIDLVMYSASTAAAKGDLLTVDQGYGHLDCVLIR